MPPGDQRLTRSLSALLLVLFAASAHADDKADKAEADKHYELGKRHYNLNEWDQAIQEFKTAYRLYPNPVNLFNIAQAFRLKKPRNCTDAAAFYASYQREEKNKKLRDSVTKVRKEMEECAKTEKPDEPLPVPPPVPADPPASEGGPASPAPIVPGAAPQPLTSTTGENALRGPVTGPEDPNRNRRILSYFLLVGGGLAVLTGVGYSLKASGIQGDIDNCDGGLLDDCGVVERKGLVEDKDRANQAAVGSYLFGGALLIGGGILYKISRKKPAGGVSLVPTGKGALVRWSF